MTDWRAFPKSRQTGTPCGWVPVACAALIALCVTTPAEPVELTEPERLFGIGTLTGATFHPGGEYFATWGGRGIVYLWDADTGEPAGEVPGDGDNITHTAYSPNGERLLTITPFRHEAVIRNSETGGIIHTLKGHDERIIDAAFSPDGTRVATGSSDKTVIVWDAGNGEALRTLEGHEDAVGSIAFSPDGTRVLTGSQDETARLWDSVTGKQLLVLEGHKEDPDPAEKWRNLLDETTFDEDQDAGLFEDADSLNSLPDPSASAPEDTETEIETEDTEDIFSFEPLFGPTSVSINAVAFSPDGEYLLTGSSRGIVRLSSAETGEEVRQYTDDKMSRTKSLAFSPDGERFAATGRMEQVILWETSTGEVLHVLEGHTDSVRSAAFSPDGKRLLTEGRDHTVRIWNPETGKELLLNREHPQQLWTQTFSPDGELIATGHADGTVRIWDRETADELHRLSSHESQTDTLVFSPDGTRLLAASSGLDFEALVHSPGTAEYNAVVWNTATGEKVLVLGGLEMPVNCAAFSPDGSLVLTGTVDETAVLWDAESGETIRRFETGERSVEAVGFSAEGTEVYFAGFGRQVQVWDIEGDHLRTFSVAPDEAPPVISWAFSQDGSVVFGVELDGLARVHDMEDGAVIDVFEDEGMLPYAAVSPEGRRVLAANTTEEALGRRGAAKIWNVGTGGLEYVILPGWGPAAFSPCGEWLLAGWSPGVARLWHAPARE